MSHDDAAPLTATQAQNFALLLKEATTALGQATRARGALMPATYQSAIKEIMATLAHLYGQTARLEHHTLAALKAQLSQGTNDDVS